MKRNATAFWEGTIKDGSGVLTTQSGVLDKTAYSYKSRFEDGIGTNPEELLAAAHAGCYTMMTTALLSEAGYNPTKIETQCKIALENGKITKSELTLTAKIPNITNEEFQQIAQNAKANCPVSVAFSFKKILVSATLEA